MKFEDYVRHDATALAALVKRGEVTPRELVDAALARLDAVDGRVHAIIHRLDESARRAADGGTLPEGPFRGVPFVVKDLDGMLGGAPYNGGTRALKGVVGPYDSELFARYRRAGVAFVGKSNTPEFGILANTEPELHGPTHNPWNLGHIAGGSSGGSAAAVAAGVVPVAHGGDGGGSIRIPAAACGLFGMKPSRGTQPLGPDGGEGWNGFVVPHVISRTVRDSAAFFDVTRGIDCGAPYASPSFDGPLADVVRRDPAKLRVAFSTRSMLGERTDPAYERATRDAAALLESLGHIVTEDAPTLDVGPLRLAYLSIVAAGTAEAIASTERLNGRAPRPEDFEATTWFMGQVAHALSAAELEHARNVVAQATRDTARFFERYDVFVTPTLAHPPARIGELALKPWERVGLAALRRAPVRAALLGVLRDLAAKNLERTPNTMLFNMTGQPAMSVPLAWGEGALPIGIQFAARFGDDATLFSLAGQLERARPWFDRRPSL